MRTAARAMVTLYLTLLSAGLLASLGGCADDPLDKPGVDATSGDAHQAPDAGPLPDRGPDGPTVADGGGDLQTQADALPDGPAPDQGPPQPATVWAISAGGAQFDSGYKIAVDSKGNSCVLGSYAGPVLFGSLLVKDKGLFVAGVDSTGQFLWVNTVPSSSSTDWANGSGVALDSAGNCFITGSLVGTVSFGSTKLTSTQDPSEPPTEDVFVAKLDSAGKWLWAVQAGGKGQDLAHDIAVDSAGNATITGEFDDNASFGASITLTTPMLTRSVFVARLSPAGKFTWAQKGGGGYTGIWVKALALDSSGDATVTGYFNGKASFGTTVLTATKGSSSSYGDLFVAKLAAATQTWTWAIAAGGTGHEVGQDIVADNAGNLIVTGPFNGPATFGKTTRSEKLGAFVGKLSSAGAWLWVSAAAAAVPTPTNNARANPAAVAVDSAGQVWVAGSFQGGAVKFGSTTLTTASTGFSDYEPFVAKLDSGGTWLWATKPAVQKSSAASDVAVDSAGQGYVTGRFYGAGNFGGTALKNWGKYDLFVWKMK